MNLNKIKDPHHLLLEFLEVAIHCILHSRKLYPDEIFTLKKKYGVPIHVSMYPELNHYIAESLNAVKEVLLKNELKQMVIYFYKFSKPIERFVFKINDINPLIKNADDCDIYLVKLRELFRSFCLKLNVNNYYMTDLPEGASFKLVIHTNEMASTSLSENPQFQNFPWIEAEKTDIILDNGRLIPLKTIEHDLFNIHIYSEESIN